ncbi:hypothetical protein BSKO_06522 [Bryopsis sp. KO-2023]|nr:hypothetical protein BSKO_06522 [Bryopsis sp. KO-2023]
MFAAVARLAREVDSTVGLLARSLSRTSQSTDVVVVGGGHNGLIAATLLATQNLQVTLLEERSMVGGACKTEYPFPKAPGLAASTGAYLLGVMPPELMQLLDIKIPVFRRDPHLFLPTTGDRHLLLGSNEIDTERQMLKFFSKQDWSAMQALEEELNIFRQDIGPTWMMQPLSIEQTAEKYVRSPYKQAFVNLCRGSILEYLNRFDFKSDLIKAMYIVGDGTIGLSGDFDTPGSGMNFLVHNMTRLPGSDGSWMIVQGGMGAVTQVLARRAVESGVSIRTGSKVEKIVIENGGKACGVLLEGDREIRASAVVVNADPFTLRNLIGGRGIFPSDFDARLDSMERDGTSLKLNLALKGLPKFTCSDSPDTLKGTIHIIPNGDNPLDEIKRGWKNCKQGKLPEFPSMEMYVHTTVDESLRNREGHHNAALFVDSMPFEIDGSSWENEMEAYSKHLISILDDFAPGTLELVVDTFPLPPPEIEHHFGMHRGHIHHIDNSFGFSDRFPYSTPLEGLYSCSAGTHPGGSVIGCGGYNCATKLLQDLGRRPQ